MAESNPLEHNLIGLWWRAIRPFAYPASVMPLLIGISICYLEKFNIDWKIVCFLTLFILSLHTSTNLFNDYYDFKNKVDRPGTMGSSGVLVSGIMKASSIFTGAKFFFAVSITTGIGIFYFNGIKILVPGIIGILGAYFYTCPPLQYKYKGVGEILVFFLLGPVLGYGILLCLAPKITMKYVLIFVTPGLLAAAILLSNNLRDLKDDIAAGVKTLPGIIGAKAAATVYVLALNASFLTIAGLALTQKLPITSMLVFITFPYSFKLSNRILNSTRLMIKNEDNKINELKGIDEVTAKLHLLFSLILSIGIVVGGFGWF